MRKGSVHRSSFGWMMSCRPEETRLHWHAGGMGFEKLDVHSKLSYIATSFRIWSKVLERVGILNLRKEKGLRNMDYGEITGSFTASYKRNLFNWTGSFLAQDGKRLTILGFQYALNCIKVPGIEGDIGSLPLLILE